MWSEFIRSRAKESTPSTVQSWLVSGCCWRAATAAVRRFLCCVISCWCCSVRCLARSWMTALAFRQPHHVQPTKSSLAPASTKVLYVADQHRRISGTLTVNRRRRHARRCTRPGGMGRVSVNRWRGEGPWSVRRGAFWRRVERRFAVAPASGPNRTSPLKRRVRRLHDRGGRPGSQGRDVDSA